EFDPQSTLKVVVASDAFTDDRKRDHHVDLQDLGDWRTLPEDLFGFRDFYEARRERIVERLKQKLSGW
ncbi:MAG: hypothetical protein OXS40_13115, partial [Gammaproteobacteria bacterium]|nr:hypothetical protein [Gammaproteobacteria bacterium]